MFQTLRLTTPPYLLLPGVDSAVYLYGHNGNNFNLDTVEFIKASPAARLHQAREDPPD